MNSIEEKVLELKREHATTWRNRGNLFWLMMLCEEVIELAGALIGLHRGPVEWELLQISAIAMNWCEKLQDEATCAGKAER